MTKPNLKVVTTTHRPVVLRDDLHDYEHKERRRVAATDWARVHIRGDRNPPLELSDRPKRSWRA